MKDGKWVELTPSRILTVGADKFTGARTHIPSVVQVLWSSTLTKPSPHTTHGLITSLSTRGLWMIRSCLLVLLSKSLSMFLKTDLSGSAQQIRLLFMSNSLIIQSTAMSSNLWVALLLMWTFSFRISALPSAPTHSLLYPRFPYNSHLHSPFSPIMQLLKFLQRLFPSLAPIRNLM